jgi:hypothetical protein
MELEEGWGAVAAAPEPDHRPPVPWEAPELSALAGLVQTLRAVLFRPGEFFGNLGREGWAEPLAFGLIVSSLGLLGPLFWQFLVLAPAGGDPGDAAILSASRGLGPALMMTMMAVSPFLALANLGVGGLCWWGSVALIGAGGISPRPGGFSAMPRAAWPWRSFRSSASWWPESGFWS